MEHSTTQPSKHRCHACAGFNLIEVTLAIAIVAVGLLAVFGLLGGGISSSRNVSDEVTATQLVADLFSEVQGGSYTNTTPVFKIADLRTDSTNISVFAIDGLNTTPTNPPYYLIRTTVQRLPAPLATADIAQLLVTAIWPVSPVSTNALSNSTSRVYFTQVARKL